MCYQHHSACLQLTFPLHLGSVFIAPTKHEQIQFLLTAPLHCIVRWRHLTMQWSTRYDIRYPSVQQTQTVKDFPSSSRVTILQPTSGTSGSFCWTVVRSNSGHSWSYFPSGSPLEMFQVSIRLLFYTYMYLPSTRRQ